MLQNLSLTLEHLLTAPDPYGAVEQLSVMLRRTETVMDNENNYN